jgi:hypothetical protein
MLVFSYAVELDAAESQAEGYTQLVKEAAAAYRARAKCNTSLAFFSAANKDLRRAEALEAKLPAPVTSADGVERSGSLKGQVTVQNEWAEEVTIVVAGISYTLPAGKSKTIATPTGSFPYEMIAGPHRLGGTIESGKSYRVKPPPSQTR